MPGGGSLPDPQQAPKGPRKLDMAFPPAYNGFSTEQGVTMALSQSQKIIAFLEKHRGGSFTARQIAEAIVLSYFMAMTRIPMVLANSIAALDVAPMLVLFAIVMTFCILGCFLPSMPLLLICVPIFVPIVTGLGYSLTHFGVFMTVALAIGFVTPPYGANLFVASGITGLSVTQISKKILPMIGVLILCLLVITFVPQITMWLPSVAYK